MSARRSLIAIACLCSTFALTQTAAARATRHVDAGHRDFSLAQCIRHASNGKPWLEKTLWALRDQEAGWLGAEVPNSNGSHDLGPLQVNSWWVPKLASLTGRSEPQIRHWLVHDACFNVNSARWIFLSGLTITQNYWGAIGMYHSPTKWRQRHYALAVARKLERRFGPEIFSRPTSVGGTRGRGSAGGNQ
jgi:hypothetical protein